MREFTVADWSVQPDRNRLERAGVRRRVTPRVMDLLVYLAERPGEVLGPDQILNDVWRDQFVGDHALLSAISALRKALDDDPRRPRVIETIPKRGYVLIAPSTARRAALAVLPLEDTSGDSAQAYFADGMTELLITELGKIPSLRVISRHSSLAYRGSRKTVPEIARELDVGWIVEGSTTRSGERVRLTVRLVDPAEDRQLWAESFELHLGGVLDLQREFARTIAAAVSARLPLAHAQSGGARDPIDPQALVAYLRGRFHYWKFSPEHFERALEYFQEAVDRSPEFSAAHAGIADIWGAFAYWGLAPVSTISLRLRAAVDRALETGPEEAEAWTLVGADRFHRQRDWPAAEAAFQRAIELNPSLAQARLIHALYLVAMGRIREAERELEVALRLDPLNPGVLYARALLLARHERTDEARAEIERLLELAPDHPPTLELLADLAWLAGSAEAIALERRGRSSELLSGALEGARTLEEGRRALLSRAAALAHAVVEEGSTYVAPMRIARLFLHGGDPEAAVDWLERGVADDDLLQFDHLCLSPAWRLLQGHRRFAAVLRALGLPPAR